MQGGDVGPESPVTGNLRADAVIRAGEGCAPFAYGHGEGSNLAPTASAQARPTEALVDEDIVFDASGSTDDRTPADQLEYAWDFGDGTSGAGQTVHHAYAEPGEYSATVTVTDEGGLSDTATVSITVTGAPDLVISDLTTVNNTGGGGGGKPRAGDKVTIQATVENRGSAEAAASEVGFALDGQPMAGSPVATGALGAGDSATVTLTWDTRGVKGDHQLRAVADAGEDVVESLEGNNGATLDVSVRGNKVTNGDFEQEDDAGTAPEGWTASSQGAGTTEWSEDGGADGSRGASITGNGGSAVLQGVPTWTSDPIDVTAGEILDLRVTVSTDGVSSAPGVGLTYLGAAGQVLDTVRLISVPLATDGLATLEESVTLPPGVVRVRVVLFGFSATDLRTAGTVTFDDVGLYGP
jgi:PKD repeat protein